jgi:hypothetical protein
MEVVGALNCITTKLLVVGTKASLAHKSDDVTALIIVPSRHISAF